MAKRRRANGEGMVRKRADGRWEGRIVVGTKNNGKPIYRYVFDKTQRGLLKKLQENINLYRDANLTEESKISLGDWLDKWMDEYMTFTIRKSTWEGYNSLIKNYIKPYLGEKTISSITTTDIQRMYNHLKKNGRIRNHPNMGKALSNSTVRDVHMLLHQGLNEAVKERIIVKNPTIGTTIPKKKESVKQILTESQLDKFIEVIKKDEHWKDFFLTEITTGLRLGEICGLKWEDFDEYNGSLKICRTVQLKGGGGISIGEPKTATGNRTIILPQSTVNLLSERKRNAISPWIFPRLTVPEKPISPGSAYDQLKKFLKEANLPPIRFHDLRHTFATHALSAGVDAKTLSNILGHTNASFTLDTYTHITSDMQRKASKIVGGFLDEVMVMD